MLRWRSVTIATLLPTSQHALRRLSLSTVNKVTACHKSTFCLSLLLHKQALLAWQEPGSDLNESPITGLMQLTSLVQWLNQKLGTGGSRHLAKHMLVPGHLGNSDVTGLRRMRSFVWTRHEWSCRSVGDFSSDIIKRRTYFLWNKLLSQKD